VRRFFGNGNYPAFFLSLHVPKVMKPLAMRWT
jgi:hypothetical protein